MRKSLGQDVCKPIVMRYNYAVHVNNAFLGFHNAGFSPLSPSAVCDISIPDLDDRVRNVPGALQKKDL